MEIGQQQRVMNEVMLRTMEFRNNILFPREMPTFTTEVYNPTTGTWTSTVGERWPVANEDFVPIPVYPETTEQDIRAPIIGAWTLESQGLFGTMDLIYDPPVFFAGETAMHRRIGRTEIMPSVLAAVLGREPDGQLDDPDEWPNQQTIELPSDEDLKKDVKSTNEEAQCVSCYENIPNCKIEPCGHVCQCVNCCLQTFKKHKMTTCPVCRAKVTKVSNVVSNIN